MVSVPGGKLALGQTVMTAGVASESQTDQKFSDFVFRSIGRHAKGDWGDLCEEDKAANDADLTAGGRILSAYEEPPMPKIWIITEWDRSVTTVLFPDEY